MRSRLVKQNFSAGFTLVEVLIAVGISFIVMMSISSMIVDMNKQLKTIEMKQERMDFSTLLKMQLYTPASCIGTLSGVTGIPAPATIDSLIAASATTPPSFDIPINSAEVVFFEKPITDYRFNYFEPFSATGSKMKFVANSVTGSTVAGTMAVEFAENAAAKNFMKLKPVTFPFSVTLDATGKITYCPGTAAAAPSRAICGAYFPKKGASTISVPTRDCILVSFGTDQSGSGHSQCYAAITPGGLNLITSGNKGWIRCEWACSGLTDPLPAGCTAL